MEVIKSKIIDFMKRYFKNHEIKDDDDIFSVGYVNSLFAMQLVMFIEKEFKFTIDREDLDIENFKTINKIVAFINSKISA